MNTVNIYILINPINNNPFYVGATKLPLNVRLRNHLRDAYLPTIKELKNLNLLPKFELIEQVDKSFASQAEGYWIQYFSQDFDLENTIKVSTYSYEHIISEGIKRLRAEKKLPKVVSHTVPVEYPEDKNVILYLDKKPKAKNILWL